MASRVGRIASRMWSFKSAARVSTPVTHRCQAELVFHNTSSASLAGGRSLPRFSSPPPPPQHQTHFGSRRSLQFSAAPGDVRCVFSMIPRHNANATARLVSKLSGDICPELEGRLARYVSPI